MDKRSFKQKVKDEAANFFWYAVYAGVIALIAAIGVYF
tara:strand:- start:408 stop:521 length:114 start_codon:yes stop_codon:yes gene_type:complete